ncbi:hypothetical protein DL98DRAFT_604453 [Cadophora sp. DSE1049]|nr:hypothetical protein DL98DRAFT_604453 [Cadophora sp. DSE1049]
MKAIGVMANPKEYRLCHDSGLDSRQASSSKHAAHYLISDPSFLPAETLRFFYIDKNWTEALMDGALSLANHWADEAKVDFCRSAIKKEINTFLNEPMEGLGYKQQISAYGFLMRSRVLSQFPDLTVSATFAKTVKISDDAKPKAPILIQRTLADDVMLVLFDPAHPELKSLRFTLPPHQQSFSIGTEITKNTLVVGMKAMYTNLPAVREKPRSEEFHKPDPGTPPTIFDWDSRCINIEAFANVVWTKLRDRLGKDRYAESSPTSAMMALQLNEPIFMLDIVISPADVEWAHAMEDDQPQFQFHIPKYPSHRYEPPPLPIQEPRKFVPRQRIQHDLPRMPIVPSPQLQLRTEEPDPDITEMPEFTLKVYPIDSKVDNLVPTNRDVPMDLVISITLSDQQRRMYSLSIEYFEVRIFCGDTSYKPPIDNPSCVRPMLNAQAEPPPPTMLSNLRFNVLRSWDDNYIVFKVVPRGKPVELKYVSNASFVIPMADVLDWDTEEQTYVYLWCYLMDSDNDHKNRYDNGRPVAMGKEKVAPPPRKPPVGMTDEWDFVRRFRHGTSVPITVKSSREKWGWIIYRTIYTDNAQWTRFTSIFQRLVRESLLGELEIRRDFPLPDNSSHWSVDIHARSITPRDDEHLWNGRFLTQDGAVGIALISKHNSLWPGDILCHVDGSDGGFVLIRGLDNGTF